MLSLLRLSVCLLLALQPVLSGIYTDLASSLGSSYRYLSRDTDLQVTNPASSIRTQDFSEIFVWDSNTVFVGAENYILKIDTDLVVETTYSVGYSNISSCIPMSDIFLSTCENYFRVFLNISNALYTCYTNRSADPVCVALDPGTLLPVSSPPLFDQGNSVPEGFISPTQPTLLYQRNFAIYVVDTGDNRRLITGSVYDDSDRNRITVIDPFLVGTATPPYITTTFYYFEDPLEVQKFFFAASFARTAHNYVNGSINYIYFMFYEPSNKLISGLAISRVARFCLQGPDDTDSSANTLLELPQMESFIKGELQCGNVFPSLVQDWLYVYNGSDYLYYAVFSSLAKGPQTSYLCIYSLSAISTEMDFVKKCDDDMRLNTLEPLTPVSDEPSIGHVGGLFTQLQRYTFEFSGRTYEMIYVSLSNGSLIKYCLSCPTNLQLVHLMQVVPNQLINSSLPELNALDRLQLSGEYLLAGGYTGLYRVPLQTCAALGAGFTECLRDPMCYFNIDSRLCEAVTVATTNSSSILHFSQFKDTSLPAVPSCSDLTGTLYVSTVTEITRLDYSWTCTADFVTVVVLFSDGSTNLTSLQANNAGEQSDSLTYFLLNETLISSFYISPFSSAKSVLRALPGRILYSHVTYQVTQPSPLLSPSCTPLPPICIPPVCSDMASCSDYCSHVNINCTLLSNPCGDEIVYTLNGVAQSIPSDPSQITVSYLDCSKESCLFQAYSRNTSTDTSTAGPSYWLHLIAPLSEYTPVLNVSRVPGRYSEFLFSASFVEFSMHTCATPTIVTWPSSIPHTLQRCTANFTAYGEIGAKRSKNATVEVYSSQQVLSPAPVQLSISKLSDNDECSFTADVTVSWQQPSYAITEGGLDFLIQGSVCGANSVRVVSEDNYVCSNIILSYNTVYSVSVTSYEPCFKKATASSATNSTTQLGPPGVPRGLGYELNGDHLNVSWSPPICVNSDYSIQYRATVYRSCSGMPAVLIHNSTEDKTDFSVALTGSDIYLHTVSITVVAGTRESVPAGFTVLPSMGEQLNCEDCRVDNVIINSNLSDIRWNTASGCSNLTIDRFYVILRLDSGQLASTNVSGTDRSLTGGYDGYVQDSGKYTVSVRLSLKHECYSMECEREAKAFLFYSVPTNGGAAAIGDTPTQCQDEKAYIILGLAVVAIACAVGNFGFMFVAFCVFCVPRKKVLCC